jgi:hypothetical protein
MIALITFTTEENWHRYKSILDLCNEVDIKAPQEILDFFDGDVNTTVQSIHDKIETAISNEFNQVDIDLTKMPKSVKSLRFLVKQ